MDRPRDQATAALVAVAVAALLLAGCERHDAPTARNRIPPRLSSRFYPPTSWAWGTLAVEGAPPLRYGVATPAGAARGQVLILPGEGEPIEAWFETVNALLDHGYVVWALDWAGQGGSGRWARTSGRAYVPSVDLDVAALRLMVDRVVRPKGGAPLVLVGDDFGAQVGLRAMSGGLPEVKGAVLSHPALRARSAATFALVAGEAAPAMAVRVGLGRESPPGQPHWKAQSAPYQLRAEIAQVWMADNPALRSVGETWGWMAAYNRSAGQARAKATLKRIKTPVLMLADPAREPAAKAACEAMVDCRFKPLAGAAPHLAPDAVRDPWLAQVAGFVEAQASGYVVAAPPKR